VNDHLVALPGTSWQVWREAVLRTTGFPVDGLDLLGDPECAAAAEAFLDGHLDADGFEVAFQAAAGRASRRLYEIAQMPRFREAVAWQNPGAMTGVDGLVRSGPAPGPADNRRLRVKRRMREELVARYWQRYCAKNETTGFFGPVCWIGLDPEAPAAAVSPGPDLLRTRRVYLEQWALAALAEALAADPEIRPWLPVALRPHVALAGHEVLRASQPAQALSRAEAAVLAACDGRRPAVEVARQAMLDAGLGLRKESDVYVLLDRLAEQDVVVWGVDLPLRATAEGLLRSSLEAIPEPAVRAKALAALDRLGAARDRVAAAAGDADALLAAAAHLDEEFSALTGRTARRREGQMYAGRTPSYEDTTRDLDVVLGGPVLEALARPLAILLQAARWLTVAIAAAYEAPLRELYQELVTDLGAAEAPLDRLWYLAQGLLFGAGERPVDGVTAELCRRWGELFGLDRVSPDTHCVQLRSSELEARAAATFAAERPGWAAGRLHSPDLHVVASSVEALARGDFQIVLGEMHAAWATFDSWVFVTGHPEPERLRRAVLRDRGPDRLLALIPGDWPRITARIARCLDEGWELGFAPAPGPDRDRLVPIPTMTVTEAAGELVARNAGGRTWPLIEVFADLVSMQAVDAFKLVGATAHTPRIAIDRLVVARETWRTTVGETGLGQVTAYRDVYLAARRWRRSLGLPERAFVKIATETKPIYVDFGGPRSVTAFAAMVRAAQTASGPGVGVVVSEMLPTPDDAWVPDAAGNRYLSELRIQVVDREPAWPEGTVGAIR
jgi:hypothetical protein